MNIYKSYVKLEAQNNSDQTEKTRFWNQWPFETLIGTYNITFNCKKLKNLNRPQTVLELGHKK